MKTLLLRNATVILPDGTAENTALVIVNGQFAEISTENRNFRAEEEVNLTNCKIYAGFVDLHNHGAVGVDVNSATAKDLHKVSRFLATKGVTAWIPTLVPDAFENYLKIIDAIDEAI